MINSITIQEESQANFATLEEYHRGGRNVLWLTVREGRKFILKGLPEELRSHPEERARLHKEYSLGLRINHPGVVGVYGFETHPEVGSVIVMEYIDGVTLDRFLDTQNPKSLGMSKAKPMDRQNPKTLDRSQPKPLEVRIKIAGQMADALSYLHSLGVSHRDLKPDNILINKRNEAKIIDLGLGDSEDFVTYKQSLGTESFGAPEQQNPFPADSRADVYSFGKLLELLLPESRFQKLRSSCLRENPEQRPTMDDVSESLSKMAEKNGEAPGKRALVIGAAVVGIVMCGFTGKKLLGTSSPVQREPEVAKVEIGPLNGEPVMRGDAGQRNERAAPAFETNHKKSTAAFDASAGGTLTEERTAPAAVDFEGIYKEYLTKGLNLVEKLGPGLNEKTGWYDEKVLFARSTELPKILNEMVEKLTEADCPMEEMTRLSNLWNEKIQEKMQEIDKNAGEESGKE